MAISDIHGVDKGVTEALTTIHTALLGNGKACSSFLRLIACLATEECPYDIVRISAFSWLSTSQIPQPRASYEGNRNVLL